MNGTVSGGWEFVWAAYLITFALIGAYAARAIAKYRDVSSKAGKHTRE